MKSKSKIVLMGFLAAGSFISSGNAHAGVLLAGFHDFEANATNENADFVSSGIEASVVKRTGLASSASSGSDDGVYGTGDDGFSTILPPVPSNDGFLSFNTANPLQGQFPLQFVLTNTSMAGIPLAALLFDSSGNGMDTTFDITFSDGVNFGTIASGVTAGGGTTTNNSFDLSSIGLVLAPNSTTNFIFQGVSGTTGLDNIAFTAIPEPSSVLALGCVLGSGLLLRSRRRAIAPNVASAA